MFNFESHNNQEKKEEYKCNVEIGSFDDIKNSVNFSILSKSLTNDWGGEQNKELAASLKELNSKLKNTGVAQAFLEIKKQVDNNE